MGKKELGITIQKKINNNLFNAYFLCIVLNYDNLYPWFYENYAQLYYNPERPGKFGKGEWLDFYGGWYTVQKILELKEFDRQYYETIPILDYIEQNINDGNYVYIYIDEYYIKPSLRKSDRHYVHDIFVYGFDSNSRQLSVIGFDDRMAFTKYTIDYDTFETAFKKALEFTEGREEWVKYEHDAYGLLIKLKHDEDFKYKFHISYFLDQLQDYIYSQNSSMREDPKHFMYKLDGNVYGMEVYKGVLTYTNKLVSQGMNLGYPIFHTLYEHKTSIIERLQYIFNTYGDIRNLEYLISNYKEVVNSFDSMRNLVIKYNATKKEGIFNDIVAVLESNETKEKELLSHAYSEITRNINV